jgi:hypothetical protein
MATQKKIIEMIGAVKTIYPYYAKETDVQTLVKTWTLLLRDYPDEAVDVAFVKCLQTCKMPPTPADVIEQLNNMLEATESTDEELWSKFTKALDKVLPEVSENGYIKCPLFGQTSADAHRRIEAVWNGLPERLQQYIGSKGELMRMSRDFTDNDLKFEKQRFLKTMPSIKKRVEYSQIAALIGGEQPKQIEG